MPLISESTGEGGSLATSEQKPVSGFSKLSKEEKIDFIISKFFSGSVKDRDLIKSFWHKNPNLQKTLDEFSENTLTNFVLPFGVAPNVLINDELFCVPMVIEESSVVAAASKAAKFWLDRGGFRTEVVSTTKIGQVHLMAKGLESDLPKLFEKVKESLIASVKPLMTNMEERGGGMLSLELKDLTNREPGYFQLWATFDTCDAMGANFINSVLEGLGKELEAIVEAELGKAAKDNFEVVMAILSNYTPECLVKAWVECPIEKLEEKSLGMDPLHFAQKFFQSVRIAEIDTYRATTHNKGIMNGIDSVILATGNDFRAVEACAHTYAARSGRYKSLTTCSIENGIFRFEISIPLSIGTVGGLTALHPMANFSLDLLGRPSASKLMEVVATIGLAQNFAALRSLVTTGIQKGHMKMHLMNILNHLETSEEEREKAKKHFEDRSISFRAVSDFIGQLRNYQ
ncbi:MAG: hydroxymethylglutaryl-CoA reductase, degradative [Bacteriovoracaceae bacterium]|nr:hydroxymethylglutaryl-CoA reductase, degradative [Bacteriovoracaceae bacterium]